MLEAPKPVDRDEIKRRVEAGISSSVGYLGSDQAADRKRLLDAYYGRPYGDEVDGFSKVVTRDVMETVEWTVAQLMRVFCGERFCEFEPENADDVEVAEEQTEFVQKVIMEEAGGAALLYDWFKDALLLRLGIVHWGGERTHRVSYESFSGLTDEQLQAVLMDESASLFQHTVTPTQMPDGSVVQLHDAKVKYTRSENKLVLTAIPPEEMLISRRARDVETAPFVGHKVQKTLSELLELGYSKDDVDACVYDEQANRSEEQHARDINRYSDDFKDEQQEDGQRRVWLHICYLRADVDGDGLDELIRCDYAGQQLLRVDTAEEIPYAVLTPVRMPHRLIGMSYADLVEDIQRIKTVITRQSLDNLYLANQPMKEVVVGKVDMSDLAQQRVGGNIRVKEAGSIREITVTPMTQAALQMIDHMDQTRTERTGISPAGQALDSQALSANTPVGTMSQAISQMMVRVELIARLFAETGVSRLFAGVYGHICRHQNQPRQVRIKKQWRTIDPRDWKERNRVNVTVGLGIGSRQAQQATLQQIFQMQGALAQAGSPVVSPMNLYHTLSRMIEAAGYKDTQNWLTDPSTLPPPPPPPPDPAIVVAQMQAQLEQQKMQHAAAMKQMDAQLQTTLKNVEAQIANMRLQGDMMRAEIDRQQADRQFYDRLYQDGVLARERVAAQILAAEKSAAAESEALKILQDNEGEPLPGDKDDQQAEPSGEA